MPILSLPTPMAETIQFRAPDNRIQRPKLLQLPDDTSHNAPDSLNLLITGNYLLLFFLPFQTDVRMKIQMSESLLDPRLPLSGTSPRTSRSLNSSLPGSARNCLLLLSPPPCRYAHRSRSRYSLPRKPLLHPSLYPDSNISPQ